MTKVTTDKRLSITFGKETFVSGQEVPSDVLKKFAKEAPEGSLDILYKKGNLVRVDDAPAPHPTMSAAEMLEKAKADQLTLDDLEKDDLVAIADELGVGAKSTMKRWGKEKLVDSITEAIKPDSGESDEGLQGEGQDGGAGENQQDGESGEGSEGDTE